MQSERKLQSQIEGDNILMKGLFAALVLLVATAGASDFKLGKVVEIHDASSLAEAAVANHPVSAQGGGGITASIPSQYLRCEITVALEGINYTAIFREDQHFRITDFSPGDSIHARIEGKKLVVKRLDGKEMKSKITRQEAVESAGQK
jgi:hypothetical protein